MGDFRYDYARTANPTRDALQECLASLEGARHGLAFASGMAATTTIMHLLDPGRRVVSVNDVYGGTYRLFSKVYEPKGYRFTYVSPEQCNSELAAHLGDDTALVWLERDIPGKEPERIELERLPFTLGRNESCDYQILSSRVSREHAEIATALGEDEDVAEDGRREAR